MRNLPQRLCAMLFGTTMCLASLNATVISSSLPARVHDAAKVNDDNLVPFPGLDISIDKCYHFCDGIRVDLKMQNTTQKTNAFTLFGTNWSIPIQKSVFADADGNTYKAQIRNNQSGEWTSIETNFNVPAGLMLRTSVMIENVPDLTHLALFDLRGAECGPHYNNYQACGRNIPVEAYPQDGSDGILCTMPWLKIDLKSCVREGNEVHYVITATNVTSKSIPIDFTAGLFGIYDNDGNTYDDNISMGVNKGSLQSVTNFLPNTPVRLDIFVGGVPSALKQIERMVVTFPYEDFKWGFVLNKTDITTPAPKPVAKKTTGTSQGARKVRK